MKIARYLVIALLLNLSAVFAADTQSSEESIRELLKVTKVRALLDQMIPQIEGMMKNAVDQALHGQVMTEEQQKIINSMMEKTQNLMKEELDWSKLEPMYTSIYSESFNQEEIDGMLAFYATPSGQAVIDKMPVVMQKTMAATQQMMGPMMQKVQAIQAEVFAELHGDHSHEH